MYDKRNFVLLLLIFLIFAVPVSAVTWVSASGCWTATDGAYTIIKWNATGTSSWTVPLGVATGDVLVIAGGGGGAGSLYAGGGGAGGAVNQTGRSISGKISIVVGVNGTGGNRLAAGGTGGDSSFGAVIAKGGGGGSQRADAGGTPGGDGGSSGGGGGATTPNTNVGGTVLSGTPDGGNFMGFKGGTGSHAAGDGGYDGGGGGGAGSVGWSWDASHAGMGGRGNISMIFGERFSFGGGGGGGGYTYYAIGGNSTYLGGIQTGGDGSFAGTNPTPGINETGGGGGGNGYGDGGMIVGARGGTGSVFVRYLPVTPTPTPTPTTTTTTAPGVTACNLSVISWCGKQDLFYWNETSDVSGYQVLHNYPQLSDEAYNYTSVSSAVGEKTVAQYISPAFESPVVIAPGLWLFTSYFNVSSAVGITQYQFRVFNRSSAGINTNLFYGHAIIEDVNSLTPELHLLTYARRNWTWLNAGDRLVIQVNASSTSVVARNAWISISGNLHASSVEVGQFLCCYGSSASCIASASEYTIPNLPVVYDNTWGLSGWVMRNAWWLILLIGALLILKRK